MLKCDKYFSEQTQHLSMKTVCLYGRAAVVVADTFSVYFCNCYKPVLYNNINNSKPKTE